MDGERDTVSLIACGPYYCLAYTGSGTLYFWGHASPESPDSTIEPRPTNLPLHLKDARAHLTSLCTSQREIHACDSMGLLYHTDLLQNLSLRQAARKTRAYFLTATRACLLLTSQKIDWSKTKVCQPLPNLDTQTENMLQVQMYDSYGLPYYDS